MTNVQEKARIVLQLPPSSGTPITLMDARSRHLEYLEHGPYIFTSPTDEVAGDEKIIHSFSINQDDLELLFANASEGVRLHFCREESGNLNIIAVPIGKDGELNIKEDTKKHLFPIVNTLEPCPSLCSKLFSKSSLNAWVENDQYFWLDPNDEQDGKTWFVEGDDGQKIYVEKPESAPAS
jgi:hypothetical protein